MEHEAAMIKHTSLMIIASHQSYANCVKRQGLMHMDANLEKLQLELERDLLPAAVPTPGEEFVARDRLKRLPYQLYDTY